MAQDWQHCGLALDLAEVQLVWDEFEARLTGITEWKHGDWKGGVAITVPHRLFPCVAKIVDYRSVPEAAKLVSPLRDLMQEAP